MPRFYCASELVIGEIVELPESVVRHCQVLRLMVGDTIELFNGKGGAFIASLCAIEKRRAQAEVKAFNSEEVELPYSITIAQALPESSKIDWVIEKSTEMGAAVFQPLMTRRSVSRLTEERAEKKSLHWQGIIESASEQCGRNRLMHLGQVTQFNEWITQHDMHRRLILGPHAAMPLAHWARHHPAQAITVIIGPEGGFTDEEYQLAIKSGAIALSMGPRILRTETAALCAVSTINALWG